MKRSICAVLFCLSCDVEPATTTPETYADFLKLSSQLSCEASLRCCGTVCTPKSDAEFYLANPRASAYLSAGLLAYDRQAAVDCLTAMQQRYTSCDAAIPSLPPNTACTKVLTPQATQGGRCETGLNTCSANLTCNNVSTTCTLRRFEGESCTSTSTVCATERDSCCQACSGLCSTLFPVGTACTVGYGVPQCQGGFCQSTTNRCVAYAQAGQPCTPTTLLCNPAANLVCLPSTTCGMAQQNGATCTDATQCVSAYCFQPNLGTSSQGTCQPQPAPITVREQLCASR